MYPAQSRAKTMNFCEKSKIHRYNQIPAVLLGPMDLTEPNWEELLYSRIQQTYRQAFDLTRYVSERIQK